MSLTQTAYTSRILIKFGSVGVMALILLWTIATTSYRIYRSRHPIYYAPTVKYGVLPKIVFPEKERTTKNFTLELPNDTIPKFSDQSKVYIIYRPNTTFLALQEDTQTAKSFGFSDNPVEIKTGIYEFKDTATNKTLTVNVLDGDFEITYPYASDQMLLTETSVPNKSNAIEIASNFLSRGDKLTDDLKNGEKNVSYWKIDSGTLKSVSSQSEANAIRVDFFRKDFDDFSLVSANFGQASVSVLISGSTVEAKKIIGVNFKDIDIDRESSSTYPLKTAEEAISDLKAGNYWTAKDVSDTNVVIRKIYLAYYEPTTLTNYLQPIFVFEGDNNFVAYVPAVTGKYTGE
ncbi:MAG: hypothetical protein KIH89_000595 [Candidatus Shapirobacteria bacterium]|nr:hypothetical protein [Candidatus Shapirobacteria bacterium]